VIGDAKRGFGGKRPGSGRLGVCAIAAHLVIVCLSALVMLVLTTSFHHSSLGYLAGLAGRRRLSRRGAVAFVVALVGVHLVNIALYAVAYALGSGPLALGRLSGATGNVVLELFFFAAETYSTLGYGDVVPTGALRVLASVESLNGLLLLAWSGAFLYGVLEGHQTGTQAIDS